MENLELELKLTVAHINTVLKHLASGVYTEVADLIALLHTQSQPQIQSAVSDAANSIAADSTQPAASSTD
jgi:hypothetical protein